MEQQEQNSITSEPTTTVLIADDYACVRKSLQIFLSSDPAITVVGEATSLLDAVYQAKHKKPDVILMDLMMPPGDTIWAIGEIKRDHPLVKIIVITISTNKFWLDAALNAGADGYLYKDGNGEAILNAVKKFRNI